MIRTVLTLLLLVFTSAYAWAQESTVTEAARAEAPANETLKTEAGQINPNSIPSLLFTYWEYGALMDAKRARGSTRPPTEAELRAGLPGMQDNYKPSPEERELRLGGIVYHSDNDWTIWFNNQRITPGAVPPDAIELRVGKEYIDIKWFDAYTNQIFPVRLRPHQRFHLDTRIFLPG